MVGPRGWISDGRTVESSSPVVVSRVASQVDGSRIRISDRWTAGSGVRWLDGIDPPVVGRILTINYYLFNLQ